MFEKVNEWMSQQATNSQSLDRQVRRLQLEISSDRCDLQANNKLGDNDPAFDDTLIIGG